MVVQKKRRKNKISKIAIRRREEEATKIYEWTLGKDIIIIEEFILSNLKSNEDHILKSMGIAFDVLIPAAYRGFIVGYYLMLHNRRMLQIERAKERALKDKKKDGRHK